MESGNDTTVVCLEGLLTLSNVYEKVKMYMRNGHEKIKIFKTIVEK